MTEENRFTELMGDVSASKSSPKSEPKESKSLDVHKAKAPKKKANKKPTGKPDPRVDGVPRYAISDEQDAAYKKKYGQRVKRGTDESIGKSANSDYDKVSVYIRSDIAHALRVVSAYRRTEMSQLVEDAIHKLIMNDSIGKATLEQSED